MEFIVDGENVGGDAFLLDSTGSNQVLYDTPEPAAPSPECDPASGEAFASCMFTEPANIKQS